jgi:ankyrin repeat protein
MPWAWTRMSSQFLGRILLGKSYFQPLMKDNLSSIIASVNQELGRLVHPAADLRAQHHLMVAEAVSRKLLSSISGKYIDHSTGSGEIDLQTAVQNLFCGAVAVGNLPLARSLLDTNPSVMSNIDAENPYFGRPLRLAAASGHLQIVRFLLELGANPRHSSNVPDDISEDTWELRGDKFTNLTKLHHVYLTPAGCALGDAVLRGHKSIADLLLGPRYRLCPIRDKPELARVLMAAARGGHTELIHSILSITGISLNYFSGLQEEMLRKSARYGHEGVVKMLLDCGTDINSFPYMDYVHKNGNPLSAAASQGNYRMVQFLMHQGAVVNQREAFPDHATMDPVEYAARCGHEEVVELLLQNGACPVRAFKMAVYNIQVHMVSWLLKRDPSLLWIQFRGAILGEIALQRAIYSRNPRMIIVMVDAGISVNKPIRGFLPISHAKRSSTKEIEEFLLRLGAVDDSSVDRDDSITDEITETSFVGVGRVVVTTRTWDWIGKY